jgi:hypothetical protein
MCRRISYGKLAPMETLNNGTDRPRSVARWSGCILVRFQPAAPQAQPRILFVFFARRPNYSV